MSGHVIQVDDPYDDGLISCRGCRATGTFSALPLGACPTPYKSPEQLLAESLVRESALQERLNVTDQKVDDLTTENAALCQAVKRSAMRIKELDLMFGRYLLGMQSAVIEQEHGKGAEEAMRWIFNGLAGPGVFAPDDATDAQAYFDREIVAIDAGMQEVLAFFDPKAAEVPL